MDEDIVRGRLVEAMGPQRKAELAIENALPGIVAVLWEARQLNVQLIDNLREEVRALEARLAQIGKRDGMRLV